MDLCVVSRLCSQGRASYSWERSSASPVMNGLRPNRSEHSEHLHEFIPGVTSYFVP